MHIRYPTLPVHHLNNPSRSHQLREIRLNGHLAERSGQTHAGTLPVHTPPHRHTSFSQLGGNAPFKDFVRSYPPEQGGYTVGIDPHALYHSWAATQYREKVPRPFFHASFCTHLAQAGSCPGGKALDAIEPPSWSAHNRLSSDATIICPGSPQVPCLSPQPANQPCRNEQPISPFSSAFRVCSPGPKIYK